MTTASEFDREAVIETLQSERRRLEELLQDVRGAEQLDEPEHGSAGGELSMADQHPAEAATETQYREQALSEVAALRGRIDDVDAALGRVDEGTYGTCAACGRRISAPRLQAMPATRFCIDDARMAEAEAGAGAGVAETE